MIPGSASSSPLQMNGRIYSPSIGRILSPDPVTQEPENGQNSNLYTYAFNNPREYTDPSGYQSALEEVLASDGGGSKSSRGRTNIGFGNDFGTYGSVRSARTDALNGPGGYSLQHYEDRRSKIYDSAAQQRGDVLTENGEVTAQAIANGTPGERAVGTATVIEWELSLELPVELPVGGKDR
ncbi:MAG: RHS repeat-associated core domain-containing protein [Pseudomonadota bacterium]